MKFKVLSTVVFLYFSINYQAVIKQPPVITETESKPASINIDSLVQSALSDTTSNLKKRPTKVYFISNQDLVVISKLDICGNIYLIVLIIRSIQFYC